MEVTDERGPSQRSFAARLAKKNRKTATAITHMEEMRTSLTMHTSILALLAFFAVVVVAPQQALESWGGEYASIFDHDPFAWEVNRYSKEVLNAFGHEHPGDAYLRSKPHLHHEHEHHHSKIERFVEGHWKSWILGTLVLLHAFYLVTAFFKWVTIRYTHNFLSLLFTMWIVMVGAVVQTVSFLISVYVLIVEPSMWNSIALFVGFVLLTSEYMDFWVLYHMRTTATYISNVLRKVTVHHKNFSLDEEEREDTAGILKTAKRDPHFLLNSVLRFFENLRRDIELHKLKSE